MATLNKVMLIGRLTDNPEPPRTLPSGNTVIKFRFAVGRSRKNPQTGQWESDPNPLYIDCEAYSRPDNRRNLPELIYQFARKGDPLYIEGRLQLDQWEDKNGGGKRFKHKVVVESIEFLGSRNPENGAAVPQRAAAARPVAPPPADELADSYGNETAASSTSADDDPIPF
ncbi:MAG: single-stranded DNA-binding protein [Gemmataceae bacterium]|nr:single-stranded DNA-binding protein [Gemmataceae bacterium]MCS7271654.1 single-stranded DNA-binding protein [Gemmataceae bacterium]MDW8242534.1 single-stranded DNA-binding protein [Thermogemmata sp.]